MSTLVFAFVAAAITGIAALALQLYFRERRRKLFKGLELRPNCLLTRHPIGLVVSTPSLFRFFDRLSTDVPLYLREHGYEVFLIEMPREKKTATLALSNALDSMRERCHLISDETYAEALTAIASKGHPMAASLTLISSAKRKSNDQGRPTLADFRPLATAVETFEIDRGSREKRFLFESRFLDLAISLAERDAMLSD